MLSLYIPAPAFLAETQVAPTIIAVGVDTGGRLTVVAIVTVATKIGTVIDKEGGMTTGVVVTTVKDDGATQKSAREWTAGTYEEIERACVGEKKLTMTVRTSERKGERGHRGEGFPVECEKICAVESVSHPRVRENQR